MKRPCHELLLPVDNGGERLRAKLLAGSAIANGASVLFVHGWDSDQQHYDDLSAKVAMLGFTTMTFDLRGHGRDCAAQDMVSRADNLRDVLTAYDALVGWPGTNRHRVVIVGTSYGGYLAAIVAAHRPVWAMALRVPALYPDALWDTPKSALSRHMLNGYRSASHRPEGNRALQACRSFDGDVLVVASAEDEVLPPASVQSFVLAFEGCRSLAQHTIAGADHALTRAANRQRYAALLLEWLRSRLTSSRKPVERRHAA